LTVVVDTSFVVALAWAEDAGHRQAVGWLTDADEELVTSPLAVGEMDFMVRTRGGPTAIESLWDDLDSGAYTVRWWADALAETIAVARRHPQIGLTDASLVALAGRLRTDRIATFDHRHFRALTTPDGAPFVVLPADAP
jgi:hypothetical protein